MQKSDDKTLYIAIVGGGKTCKTFLEKLRNDSFPYIDMEIVSVCDINPKAEGLLMAKEMGIHTTQDFREIFKADKLNTIAEFTNNKDLLIELISLCPEHVGIVEHHFAHFLISHLNLEKWLKSMEHKLKTEKNSSEFIMHNIDAAVVVVNTDFTIADVNEAYLKIVNKSKEEVLGHYCHEIYYGLGTPCSSSIPTLECPMLETLKTGKTAQVIHEYPKSQNQKTYCNILTYPLKNEDGEVTQVIEIWRDITEEISSTWEQKSNELKANLNKLIQEDRLISLGKLSASCVHEINNPIQGLLTFSDLMQDLLKGGRPSQENIDQFKHFLTLMSKELERCGNIVSGLLSFSRETQLEYRSLNFSDVLDSVIMLTRHRMELQNIHLDFEPPSKIITVRGDESQLQQALLNLLFNAIEAMPEGGRLGISTRIDEKTKHLIVEISDTGHGIEQQYLPYVFDPFFTTKEEGSGTGLGLSIAYGIIKNHGGKIKVKSEVGQGTVFTLSFQTV